MPARLGRYRLIRRLAVGGMAEVHLAVAEGLSGFEKRVVVKRLLPQHARDAELVAMFLDEARLVAALEHPNIGEVYDVGAEDGEYYFAMEHVAGRDLRDLLAATPGEPLPLAEGLAIVRAVAEGLHHAHEQRDEGGRLLDIVHRDVSPSNVLVSAAGQVKLIDFGVAKWSAQRTETRHGVLKGKCAYMSPEQCRAEALDRRSDVFSLGVLLYEVTTGGRPFEGQNDFEVMTAIVRGEVEPPSARWPDYPPALEPIVLRALAPRREDRQQSAAALVAALDAFVAAAGVASSSAALAGLLARHFGDAGAELDPPRGSASSSELVEPLAAAPGSTPAPARPALDRTATDHQAAATIAPLSLVEPVSEALRAVSARRIAILAGVGLACLTAVAAAGPWLRKPQIPVAGPSRHVVAAPPPVVSSPVVSAAPAPTATAVAPPDRPAPPVASMPRRARAAKKPPPTPSAAAPAPTVKVWDPDSPVPPQ